MLIESEFLAYDFVWAISEAVDLVSPALNNHNKKVAYLAGSISQEMGMKNDEIQIIILAAMLHDIGSFSFNERMKLLAFESDDADYLNHSLMGYELLKGFPPLTRAAELIKYHHAVYEPGNSQIPIGSYILHLADRISVLYREDCEILGQAPEMLETIRQSYKLFHPDTLTALFQLAKKEYFWFEAFSAIKLTSKFRIARFSDGIIDIQTLRGFAKVVANIIDFRSKFTATHSSGVSAVAFELTGLAGFSERDCKLMEIAGFLHDLGKLAVPNEILEKNGPLTDLEFNIIRKHTYYTFEILNRVNGFEKIATMAAYHHEKPDGSGYPFHVKGEEFSVLSRIMAVSDIVTALTEDRPYRMGMDRQKVEKVLHSMTKSGALDNGIAELAISNFSIINDVRMEIQHNGRKVYDVFRESVALSA